MNIVKVLYASLIGASLLLGGHLTYLMGISSVPTKSDVKKQLQYDVYQILTYSDVRVKNRQ